MLTVCFSIKYMTTIMSLTSITDPIETLIIFLKLVGICWLWIWDFHIFYHKTFFKQKEGCIFPTTLHRVLNNLFKSDRIQVILVKLCKWHCVQFHVGKCSEFVSNCHHAKLQLNICKTDLVRIINVFLKPSCRPSWHGLTPEVNEFKKTTQWLLSERFTEICDVVHEVFC